MVFKKITKKQNKVEIIIASLAVLALLMALVPLYRLALYAAPYYDDYSYGLNLKIYLDGLYPEHLIKYGFISLILKTVKGFWYSWQGTYGSILFMSLMPASFGEKYYFMGLWAIITCITVAAFLFAYLCCKYYGRGTKALGVIISSAVALYLIETIYSAHQGYFWYNGAVHYTFMHGLMLFLLSSFVGILNATKKISKYILSLVAVILGILVAGANFNTALQGALLLILFVVFGAVQKKKSTFLLLPCALAYAVGMFYNITAPGNSVRAQFFNGYSPIKAVIYSIKDAFIYIPSLTKLITVAFILVLVPFLYLLVKKVDFNFKYPYIVTLFSLLFYATGFTPSLYGMGEEPLARTMNTVKFTLQLLIVFNEAYWIGWAIRKWNLNTLENIKTQIGIISLGLALALISFVTSGNRAGEFSSFGAYYYVHTGEAACFRQEHEYRIDKINASNGGDVILSPHVFRPWFLCGTEELEYSKEAEQNRFMAQFYYVNSISLDNGMGNID